MASLNLSDHRSHIRNDDALTGQSATDRPQIWDFTRRVVAVSRGALRVNIIKQAH